MASVGAHMRAAMAEPHGIAGTHVLVVHPTRVGGPIAPMPVRIGVIVPICARVRRTSRSATGTATSAVSPGRERRSSASEGVGAADITSGRAEAIKRTMRRYTYLSCTFLRRAFNAPFRRKLALAEIMAGYGKSGVRTPAPRENDGPLVGTTVRLSGLQPQRRQSVTFSNGVHDRPWLHRSVPALTYANGDAHAPRAPATAVAGARKIATEFPPDILIVAMSMAIVSAIDPHIAPATPVLPSDAVTSRCVGMATVLGLADAPLAALVGDGGRGAIRATERR